MEDAIYCQTRIAEEERMAAHAPSPEAAEMHQQLALLYRAQLGILMRRRRLAEG